jgi:hypothetical protein
MIIPNSQVKFYIKTHWNNKYRYIDLTASYEDPDLSSYKLINRMIYHYVNGMDGMDGELLGTQLSLHPPKSRDHLLEHYMMYNILFSRNINRLIYKYICSNKSYNYVMSELEDVTNAIYNSSTSYSNIYGGYYIWFIDYGKNCTKYRWALY